MTQADLEAANRTIALKVNAAGNAAMLRKDYATAIADYRQALQLYHGGFFEYVTITTFRNNLAIAMGEEALLAFNQANYAVAITEYQQALPLLSGSKKTKNYKQIQANIALAQ